MSFAIRRSSAADKDLLEIWLSLAIDDQASADRQLDRIHEGIARLADFPFIGAARPELGAGIRAIRRSPFLIVYEIREKQRLVVVIRVVDGRRDLATLSMR